MHEQGYQYLGPASMYNLTIMEILRLQEGYALINDPEGKNRLTDHDRDMIQKFKERNGDQ